MRFYDFRRHWTKRVMPHLSDPTFNAVLVRDFGKYTFGRWNKTFHHGDLPEDFESCDWQFSRRGPAPRYWAYVKHGACHWLVNANLRLAELAEPKRSWRIVTSQLHSTVWDGADVLFDMNGAALFESADQAFAWANRRVLTPGKRLRVYQVEHHSAETARLAAKRERAARG